MELLQLADGQRLMRFEDAATGLCVERKIAPNAPVVAQKAKLLRLFEAMLASDATTA
ncbi:MAG: hypothetical protein JWR15_2896 [Prosthecobacter sp.]|nr:hypothetical protein [Prosthecobacter sp.]